MKAGPGSGSGSGKVTRVALPLEGFPDVALELVLQIQEEDMLPPSLPFVCLPKAHSPTPPPEASASSFLGLSGLKCSTVNGATGPGLAGQGLES